MFDDAKNVVAFVLFGNDEEHAHALARIKTSRIDDGATTIGLVVHQASNLFILVGNNKKLHRPAQTIHHLVDRVGQHHEHNVAIDDFLPAMGDEIARRDDAQVASQNDVA